MESDPFLQFEQKLGVESPAEYRRFLEAYPVDLHDALNVLGAEDHLFDNPHAVMMQTLACRQYSSADSEFPIECLCIGEDGFGNYFCLNTSQSPAGVFFFDREEDEFQQKADSIGLWWPQLLAELQG